MQSFIELGLDARLCAALAEQGIETPFPIQSATLGDALAGRDICAMAPTGSGKTLAFGLALLQRCQKASPRRPRALVLVPTRELAQQVAAAIMPFGKPTQRWVMAFYGGAGMDRQIQALRRGVDIAVATPGRLTDLVKRGECDLSDIETIVLDEADRMADMGFMPQVRWLLDFVPPKRQVLLFSATLDGDVGELVAEYLNNPVRHEVAGQHVDGEEGVALRAPQYRVVVRQENKLATAAQLTGAARRALVFVKNRFSTERIAEQISYQGPSALYLHGGMSQYARTSAVKRWAAGEATVLVATDIAARGLHVENLDLVVHYDAPQDEKDFVHRSGRTARAGNRGVVVNLIRKEHLRATEKMESRLGVEAMTVELSAVMEELSEISGTLPADGDRDAWAPGLSAETDRDSEVRVSSDRYDRSGGDRSRGDHSRGDRPWADRPRDDRPRGDRPRGDRPWADRPREDRPREDRPWAARPERTNSGWNDRPREERPRDDRPREDRPWAARPERASNGWNERPRADRPAAERQAGDRPFPLRPDRPQGEWNDRPRFERPREDRPWGARPERTPGTWIDQPQTDRPQTDRPQADRPRDDRPRQDRSWATRDDRPQADRPRDDRPRNDWNDRPRDDRPGRDRPWAEHGERPSRPTGPWKEQPTSDQTTGPSAPWDGEVRQEREHRAPRFDDTGRPLNRRARRSLEFGAVEAQV